MLTCLLFVMAGCSTGLRQAQNAAPPGWYPAKGTQPPPRKTEPAVQAPPLARHEVERVWESPRLAPPPSAPAPVLAGPHTNLAAETWIPLDRWAHENGCGPLRLISTAPTPTFALNTANGTLTFRIKSLVANWDGLELRLGFEPQLINDSPFIHFLDLKKNIEPLIHPFSMTAKTNRVVVLDPGHGGRNTGATSVADGVEEKEFTLDWARRLAPLLEADGWQVFLTRTNDVDVPLSERVAFAEECHADLFISLHFNSAAPSREQAGLETYCLTPTGLPSTLTRGYDDDASLVFTNNAFDAANLQYAVLLHRALAPVIGSDRGVRHARFLGVLRGQNRPAVLIEGGYLSNPAEARRIADPAYRQELAQTVAEALADKSGPASPHPEIGDQTSSLYPASSAPSPPACGFGPSNSPADNPQLP